MTRLGRFLFIFGILSTLSFFVDAQDEPDDMDVPQEQPAQAPVQQQPSFYQPLPTQQQLPSTQPQQGPKTSTDQFNPYTSPGPVYIPNLPDTPEQNQEAVSATITFPRNPPAPKLSQQEQRTQAQEDKDRRLRYRIEDKIYIYSGGYAKTVRISSQNGKVVLKGEVPSVQDKIFIEKTAKAEAGPNNVVNELQTFKDSRTE